jgi:DNA replication protein DnaC
VSSPRRDALAEELRIANQYEHASVMITTNLDFAEWSSVFGDAKMTTALLWIGAQRPARRVLGRRRHDAHGGGRRRAWPEGFRARTG